MELPARSSRKADEQTVHSRQSDFIKIFDVVYEHVNLTANGEFKTSGFLFTSSERKVFRA